MKRGGMSLIELLVVMAIIAIFGAIAMPKFAAATAHYRVDAASKRIAADFGLAQAVAKATSLTQTVTFNQSANSYQVSNIRGLDRSSTYSISLAAEPYRATLASVALSGTGNAQVAFNLYGIPSAGGSVVVQCGSFRKTITVDSATGQVTIQ